MPGPLQANFSDHIKRKRCIIHFNAAHIAVDRAQHIIINQQAFQTEAQQRSVHTRHFIHHVDASHGRNARRHTFFIAGLHIRKLRIAHASCRAHSEIVKMPHLPACRCDECLLTRPTRHRTGAQIGNERPWPPNRNGTGHHAIDINQPCQTLTNSLHNCASQCCRRSGPSLRCR